MTDGSTGTTDGSTGTTDVLARVTDRLPDVRRVFDVLLVMALVLVVVPFVVYAVPSLVGAEDSYVVRSGSMEPAIGTGDVVIVERATPTEIETGDVITFVPDGQPPPTTHRVVSKTEADGVIRFTTKGDANDQSDAEPVVENELVGEVTLVLPYVGYIVSFASTSMGFFALVAAPFGLLVATEVWSVFREGGDSDEETDHEGAPTPTPGQTAADTAADTEAYTLSPTDMRLSLAILLVLTVYSSFVAYSRPTPWSIAVAVGAFGTAVYLAAMRYTAATAATSAHASTPAGGLSGSAAPPAREVTPAAGDRRGADPVTVGDGVGSNGTLRVSLAASPTAARRHGSDDPDVGSDGLDVVSPGESASAGEDADEEATDPPDQQAAATDSGDERAAESPATDAESEPESRGADAESKSRGSLRWLRDQAVAVWQGAHRSLYTLGYLEVTAVRTFLQRMGLRSADDGGEQ